MDVLVFNSLPNRVYLTYGKYIVLDKATWPHGAICAFRKIIKNNPLKKALRNDKGSGERVGNVASWSQWISD